MPEAVLMHRIPAPNWLAWTFVLFSLNKLGKGKGAFGFFFPPVSLKSFWSNKTTPWTVLDGCSRPQTNMSTCTSLYCLQMDIWDLELMRAWKITELRAVTSVISAKYLFLLFHEKYMHLIACQLPISQGYMTWKIVYPEVVSLSLLQGNLPNPGIEPMSPTLQAGSLPLEPQGKPKNTGAGNLSLLQQIFLSQE